MSCLGWNLVPTPPGPRGDLMTSHCLGVLVGSYLGYASKMEIIFYLVNKYGLFEEKVFFRSTGSNYRECHQTILLADGIQVVFSFFLDTTSIPKIRH